MIRALKRLWIIRQALFSERMFVVWETETQFQHAMLPREITVKELKGYRGVCDIIFSAHLNSYDVERIINEPRKK